MSLVEDKFYKYQVQIEEKEAILSKVKERMKNLYESEDFSVTRRPGLTSKEVLSSCQAVKILASGRTIPQTNLRDRRGADFLSNPFGRQYELF